MSDAKFANWKEHYEYLLELEKTRKLTVTEAREIMAIENTLDEGLCPDCGDSHNCTLCYNDKEERDNA